MNIFIYSDIKNIANVFAGIAKSKNHILKIAPASQFKKDIKNIPAKSLIYADISSFKQTEVPQILKMLAKLDTCRYAIIDPKDSIADIAQLFHNNASDYIGPALLKAGISQKRLDQVCAFKKFEGEDDAFEMIKKDYIISGNDWKNIKVGQEYTFFFMFVELDNKEELKTMGPEQFNRITGAFHQYLEEAIAPIKGKIWIWMDFGGLILFPFDGKKRCDAIEAAFRLMINRQLMSAEIIMLDINLSYRIAMHIGNTEYKTKGETGTIISDSINSVFHLGQKYSEPGGFYLTNDIFLFTPGGLMNYFVPAGEYEGRHILRMKRIV